jgi:hypothetical protein
MILLVIFTGLITGVVEALIARIWFQSVYASWSILVGAIIGSWSVYFFIFLNREAFSYIYKFIWVSLWEPLGNGRASPSNFAALALLPITIWLVHTLGSLLGGLLGLFVCLNISNS